MYDIFAVIIHAASARKGILEPIQAHWIKSNRIEAKGKTGFSEMTCHAMSFGVERVNVLA